MRFEKSKPNRILKQFICIEVDGYWWFRIKNKIHLVSEFKFNEFKKNNSYEYCSSGLDCHSLRRFRKILKKFNIQKGTAILYNRFKGYDIYY